MKNPPKKACARGIGTNQISKPPPLITRRKSIKKGEKHLKKYLAQKSPHL
jgi:hypothetical protein